DRKETITRGLVIGILRGAGAGVKGPVYHHPAVRFACQPPYRTDHLSLHRIDEVCDSEGGLERRGSNPLVPAQRVFGKHENGILNRKKVDLQLDGNQGVGALAPGFGALNETNYTPMLHQTLPEKIWFYPIALITRRTPRLSKPWIQTFR